MCCRSLVVITRVLGKRLGAGSQDCAQCRCKGVFGSMVVHWRSIVRCAWQHLEWGHRMRDSQLVLPQTLQFRLGRSDVVVRANLFGANPAPPTQPKLHPVPPRKPPAGGLPIGAPPPPPPPSGATSGVSPPGVLPFSSIGALGAPSLVPLSAPSSSAAAGNGVIGAPPSASASSSSTAQGSGALGAPSSVMQCAPKEEPISDDE